MALAESQAPLAVALIGCGGIARSYLQALAALPGCRLTAVADIYEDAARRVAEPYDCAAYGDYRRVLQGSRVEAVVIATPPATHAEIAGFFLSAGVHALCEKPLALNSREAALMLGQAEESGALLMMASKFRYVDAVVRARSLLQAGALGRAIGFENSFCSEVDMRGRWNSDKAVAGGGVLIDNGCHSVDIARFFLGPLAAVRAEAGENRQGLEVEETVRMDLRAASGAAGRVDLSWSMASAREDYISLRGTEGELSIGWSGARYKRNGEREWTSFGEAYDKLAAMTQQVENFANAIRGRAAPLVTSADGLASVKAIDAAYRSMASQTWVEVEAERARAIQA